MEGDCIQFLNVQPSSSPHSDHIVVRSNSLCEFNPRASRDQSFIDSFEDYQYIHRRDLHMQGLTVNLIAVMQCNHREAVASENRE
jgi:hypothetical protein